jgi:hypothetical protein
VSLYECPIGHLSREPGTCHTNGCFRRLTAVEAASDRAYDLMLTEAVQALELDAYHQEARGKRWWEAIG